MNIHTTRLWLIPMQLMAVTIAFVITLGMSPTASATESKDVQKEIGEALAAIQEYSVEQKDAAVAKAKELMDEVDDQIHVWEDKSEAHWQDMKESSKENYRNAKKELAAMRNDLSEWYGSMKYSSKEAWDEAKAGFIQTYEDVRNAIGGKEENKTQ